LSSPLDSKIVIFERYQSVIASEAKQSIAPRSVDWIASLRSQ